MSKISVWSGFDFAGWGFFGKMGNNWGVGEFVNNWFQIAYQYVVGGIFFGVTLWLCFYLGGASVSRAQDRRTLKILLGGYFGYLLVHLLWAYLARF